MVQVGDLVAEWSRYEIKVVSDAALNEDGLWVDCGFHKHYRNNSFVRDRNRLLHLCPKGHHIVAIKRT